MYPAASVPCLSSATGYVLNEPQSFQQIRFWSVQPKFPLSSNSKCNTSGPDGLRCCHAKALLHAHEYRRTCDPESGTGPKLFVAGDGHGVGTCAQPRAPCGVVCDALCMPEHTRQPPSRSPPSSRPACHSTARAQAGFVAGRSSSPRPASSGRGVELICSEGQHSQLDFPRTLQYRSLHAPVAQLDRAAVS